MSISAVNAPEDLIAAIATPLGGGVSIIRVSGEGAGNILSSLFGAPKIEDRRVYYGRAVYNGELLDECLYFLMRAPRSYTKEDVAEIQCHGGADCAGAILSASLALGARLAEPGEFTKRAFLNGRIDLSRAEAVSELISAGSERARKAAVARLGGETSRMADSFAERIVNALSKVEANIDFPEDVYETEIITELASLNEDLAAWRKSAGAGEIVQNGLKCAIVGKPNVGKSSIMNILCADEVSIVTPAPGTTRDVLRRGAQYGGVCVTFCDTAGVRFSSDEPLSEAEEIGVRRALNEAGTADFILFVTAGDFSPQGEDSPIIDSIGNTPVIAVCNKIDIYPPDSAASERFGGASRVSAKTGEGIGELKLKINEMVSAFAPDCGGLMASRRQLDALERCSASVTAALKGAEEAAFEDIIATELKDAFHAICEITGRAWDDGDVIDNIFDTFCVGK